MTAPVDNQKREIRVSYKKGSLAVLALFSALALGYGMISQTLSGTQQFGPSFVPTLLAILLLGACIGAAIQTIRQKDHDLQIGQVGKVVATLAITAGYILVWQYTGAFYLATTLFMVSLISLLDQSRFKRTHLIINISSSVLLTVFVYFFFEVLIGVRF